ncbi:MAG TPA: hypothetical protein VGN69_10660 [Solirubrobacteraceae bacterium]|nr:hypothetical protein [Solirubrobacteraceae bacterium]
MLFDLRGRGRRRTVQGIYLALAVLMGGGLVLFGIGGATNGGLVDALNGGAGNSNTADNRLKAAEKRVRVAPSDPTAWAEVTRLRFQAAGTGANYDSVNGTFTAKGKAALAGVKDGWEHYLALNPKVIDTNLAAVVLQAMGANGLADFQAAARAAEIVASAKPSAAIYEQLAAFSYEANLTRKGDLASAKAVSLAPAAQRNSVKQQLTQLKQQIAQQAAKQALAGAGAGGAPAPAGGAPGGGGGGSPTP